MENVQRAVCTSCHLLREILSKDGVAQNGTRSGSGHDRPGQIGRHLQSQGHRQLCRDKGCCDERQKDLGTDAAPPQSIGR